MRAGRGHRYIYPKQFDQYYPNDTVSYPPKTGWGIPKDIPVRGLPIFKLGCVADLVGAVAPQVMAPHDWTGEGMRCPCPALPRQSPHAIISHAQTAQPL